MGGVGVLTTCDSVVNGGGVCTTSGPVVGITVSFTAGAEGPAEFVTVSTLVLGGVTLFSEVVTFWVEEV